MKKLKSVGADCIREMFNGKRKTDLDFQTVLSKRDQQPTHKNPVKSITFTHLAIQTEKYVLIINPYTYMEIIILSEAGKVNPEGKNSTFSVSFSNKELPAPQYPSVQLNCSLYTSNSVLPLSQSASRRY